MHDPRSLRLESHVEAHTGGITDIDVKGDLVVSCGFSNRMGTVFSDPMVKVYDLRTFRALPPAPFPLGPFLCRFHPTLFSTVLVASHAGQFQLLDVGNSANAGTIFQVDCKGDSIMSMDFANSGEVIAFTDNGGYVHQWADRDEIHVNAYSRATELVDPTFPPPTIHMEDNSILPAGVQPFSSWPMQLSCTVPKTRTIEPEVLASLKWNRDFVGYASNTSSIKRYSHPIHASLSSSTGAVPASPARNPPGSPAPQSPNPPRKPQRPTKMYRHVEIKYAKLGVENFDFSLFNKTKFGGLENTLLNSYCNSMLQTLYFIPQLRAHVLNHLCSKELCLACELSFFFHMLDLSKGQSCQPTNLLRCLRLMPAATTADLLEPQTKLSLAKRIEKLNRFMIGELNTELGLQGNHVIDQLFGLVRQTRRTCGACKRVFFDIQKSRTYHIELAYPNTRDVARLSFASVLRATLGSHLSRQKQQCSNCGTMQDHEAREMEIKSLPAVLSIHAALPDKFNPKDGTDVWKFKSDDGSGDLNESAVTDSLRSHGLDAAGHSWLPFRIKMQVNSEGELVVQEYSDAALGGGSVDMYELTAVQVCVTDPSPKATAKMHAVAHVRVPGSYLVRAGGLPPESAAARSNTWFLFNDFLVSPTAKHEVTNFNVPWKTPCVLFYTRVDVNNSVPVPPFVNPITERVLFAPNPFEKKIEKPSFKPLVSEELPKKGDVLAIDAEFVSNREEVTEMHTDGTQFVIKPGEFALARVSVLRPLGSATQEPCMDDYIVAAEPVRDYVTRFSGIRPGDLDPSTSEHYMMSLKSVYLKLRYLADRGCIFLGHGLKKDFRIINLVLPPEQVIDTVELFSLKRQRKISLKFLASYVLQQEIQTDTHDSIEDARTAQALYVVYKKLEMEGTFEETLQKIYHFGRAVNWGIRNAEIAPTGPAAPVILAVK